MMAQEIEATETTAAKRKTPPTAWLLLLAGLVVALGVSYAAYTLAGYSWAQVVDYDSPFITAANGVLKSSRPALDTPIPGATSRRTVLVVIDGLTDATSRTMPSIEALRKRGNDVALTVPQPSLSYPTWTTILTGATPQISGVTTNWYEKRVPLETLMDVAAVSGRSVVVASPKDIETLYSASKVASTAYTDWVEGDYVTDTIVDDALSLAGEKKADFVFALFPDVDEAGHSFGQASEQYAATAAQVDADLARLIDGLDDGNTVFVVLPDHGHVPAGGHGGWEDPVTHTFAAFAGPGVKPGDAKGRLQDAAPTVALLAGFQAPSGTSGVTIDGLLADSNGDAQLLDTERSRRFENAYSATVTGSSTSVELADAQRLASDRVDRLPLALGLVAIALVVLAAIGIASWRALVAALSGALAYVAVYNGFFFLAHRYAWSLSTFNEESMIQAFFNGRMVEAVIAGLIACAVAGDIYLLMRPEPKGVRAGFTVEWMSLGLATALAIQVVLGVQVAWFLWQWGAETVWRLPDLMWGFKYDLDLIQMTAIAGVAILGPVVTYLIGRFHPRVRAT
ncbi:MAG: alkaline phosphatase family protein [Actinomycetota bacterium]|nr:alkaline phosphatase family protein [Actinomycetota bacterium]